jgi:integrase
VVEIEATWWAAWREPGGRYHRERFEGADARARAVKAEGEARRALRAGTYVAPPVEHKGSLTELFELYFNAIKHKRKAKNLKREQGAAKRVTNGFGMELPINRVSSAAVEGYRRKRTDDGRAVATTNRELAVLAAALSWAVDQGWLAAKPKIAMPNPQNERLEFLTREEAAAVILAAKGPWRSLFRAAFATGMRRGELLAMRWEWINERTGLIHVPTEVTKNGRARHIPINADMLDVLADARADAYSGAGVFHHPNGKPLTGSATWNEWARTLRKAGVRHVPFHAARHTFASWMVQAGVDLNKVRELLGHRSFVMVLRYSHLRPDHLRAAVDAACITNSEPASAPAHRGESPNVVHLTVAKVQS